MLCGHVPPISINWKHKLAMTRILLADDHTLMRQGLRHILMQQPDLEVVAEASSGAEAVKAAKELKPDVVIMDIAMEGLNGIEATSQILQQAPGATVLILYLVCMLTSGT